jgi:hypothetical protein
MNLLAPSTWPAVGRFFGAAKSNEIASSALARAGQSLGIFTDTLGSFIPREVNPYFYESLREALGILDGAVNRLVTLDGIVRLEGDNDALVQKIRTDLLESIQVNDNEAGLQAAYESQGNELYEQGLGAIEMVMDKRGRELVALRVADSKGIAFDRDPDSLRLRSWYRPPTRVATGRRDGTDQVEAVVRGRSNGQSIGTLLANGNYVALNPERMVWALLQPEADSPYGVSLFRSMEFAAQILLKIQNATGQTWDRYGDPCYALTYKTKNRKVSENSVELTRRQKKLADDLAGVLNAKRKGNSADFVQAIAADDEIVLQVIGAKDQVLEIEMPARHLLEQIVAKTGVPAWLLGLQWTTAERLAQQQSEIVLQESKTRFERRLPGLRRIVETWMRGRGLTWKAGDWKLTQELPNLHDELKRAQAAFLNAQTEFMQRGGDSGANQPPPAPGTDQGAAKAPAFRMLPDGTLEFGAITAPSVTTTKHARHTHAHKAEGGEPWAESDPELPRIASRTVASMLADWRSLEGDTLTALGIAPAKAEQVWQWTPDLRAILDALADEFEIATGSEEGGLMRGMLAAWRRGVENAVAEFDAAEALEQIDADAARIMREHALELARSVTTRTYRVGIIEELETGAYNGLSPAEVAQKLRERFDAHDYDWERLAHSEIAQQQSYGKRDEYLDLGVTEFDFITANASSVCPLCTGHAAANPHPIATGPLPVRDTHPLCRCSIRARMPAS